jgi:AraC family transcriptional regulator, transcriptional activator of pobA
MFACGGDCIVDLDRRSQRVASPCFLAVPSGYVHGFALSGRSEGWVLTVPDALLQILCGKAERRLTEPFFSAPTVLGFDSEPESAATFVWLMRQLEAECTRASGAAAPALESLLSYLLVLVLRRLNSSAPESKKADRDRIVFARFRRLVEEHYTGNWSVGRFSDALGVSRVRLNRLCANYGGGTAYEIVLNRLCLEAQRRLLYTSAPAARIAHSLGFQDAAYFSRFFSRRVGLPPGEFRERRGLEALDGTMADLGGTRPVDGVQDQLGAAVKSETALDALPV